MNRGACSPTGPDHWGVTEPPTGFWFLTSFSFQNQVAGASSHGDPQKRASSTCDRARILSSEL